ncbi:MAG TPA: hemerythrin domain-containing protein [Candidatus Hydrogenedentes bacterium]|nr:hemerythrin domain-containing protein [Candidatus Hydrogenedentota bacterium]HOV75002.1 hemerythrin domain-containing protein [Candidatus Hydrogenedentota bacterium]HPC15165.1 hemerythrin domain-containing protein [Candidatus Hydrogenedentota bacterium]HRT19580.1 hemerythrin domain-containing protein [Candidatus Hydrogenedentota bacterium]HRT64164.1 hemerythrin domain-containing protein [Candidatus Hydrogenedentota bacterium]
MLRWREDRYGTGIPIIDEQHKALFGHIVELLKASEAEERVAEFQSMIEFLGEYANNHFDCEEALMEQRGCSKLRENREDHHWFRDELGRIRAMLSQYGNTEPLREMVMGLLVQWLEVHIAGVDTGLREPVRA